MTLMSFGSGTFKTLPGGALIAIRVSSFLFASSREDDSSSFSSSSSSPSSFYESGGFLSKSTFMSS
jgi:hypothetical protein